MGDERGREGNGAVVAIVLGLGVVVMVGILTVLGAGFLFLMSATPPVQIRVAATAPVPAPTAMKMATAPVVPSSPLSSQLPIQINSNDEIIVSGETKTLSELKQTFHEIKNGNSLFTEVKIKFEGSSEAKTQEVFLVLKEACILYEVDPTGKIPAEPADSAAN